MKKMLLILFVVVFSFPVFSQQAFEGTSVNSGNIYTTDSEVIEAQYIVFLKDSIEFYLENSQTRYVLGLNQVTEVLEYHGNYATTGWIVGTLVGVGIGTAIAVGNYDSDKLFPEYDYVPGLVGSVVGALAGWLIGSQIEDWETVYSKSAAFLKNFNIKQNNHSGLTVSYTMYF